MSFKRILIPVDFTVNTDVAIAKAITLCEDTGASIHLLHVIIHSPLRVLTHYTYLRRHSIENNNRTLPEIEEQMEMLSSQIKKARPGIVISRWITLESSIQRGISKKAKSINADLIVIGKNSQHSVFPFLNTVVPSRLVNKTGISVLTVKPGALSNSLRTVVVPVGSSFPEKKIAIINSLGNRFFIHIRLVILVEKGDDPDKLQASLLNICRVLKNRSFDNISYEVVKATHKGWDILNYCRRVGADLLVVHPVSETKLGWMNKHISDELPVTSKTQILTVSQSNFSII